MADFTFPDYRLGTQSPQGAIPALGVNAPIEAFGGGLAAAQLERTAANLGQAAQDFGSMASRAARAADEARVEGDLNTAIAGNQADIDAFRKLAGREAIDGAEAAVGRLRERSKGMIDGAANEAQRRLLRARLDPLLADSISAITVHVGQQTRAAERNNAAGRQVLVRKEAQQSWSDGGKVEGLAESSTAAARDIARMIERRPGSDIERIMVADARFEVYRDAIDAALAGDGYAQAKALFAQVKGRIDPTNEATLQRRLDTARIDTVARGYAQRVTATASGSADLERQHQQATKQNERDWAKDAEQRRANQLRIDAWFQRRRATLQADANGLDEAVHDWVTKLRPDGQPQTERPPPALWNRLSPEQRQSLDAVLVHNAGGTKAATDPLVWDEIHRGLLSDDPATRRRAAHVPLWQHRHHLSDADFQSLATLQGEARNGDPNGRFVRLRNDRLVDQTLRSLAPDAATAARFRYAVLGEIADFEKDKGRRATPEEAQAVVDSHVRWIARGGNRPQPIAIADVPPEERVRIADALRRNGWPVTDQAIVDLYNRSLAKVP